MAVDVYFPGLLPINWRSAAEGMNLNDRGPLFVALVHAVTLIQSPPGLPSRIAEGSVIWVYNTSKLTITHRPVQIEEAKAQGADHGFNAQTNADYLQHGNSLTGGEGCHVASNYNNFIVFYASTPDLLRMNSVSMVTDTPHKPLQF
ncbi:hypothetical protein LTR36_000215 [Oleoguttula mirabilis]|uniref:Uncharacterized protein n=1 Tax=Oleoguttula mirabilis TaxID=1507867 RepID=A0AAV9JXW9_9PEZI|nr:hypothetical protein LTR36_000215 [Oleoguttula mirabilis]